MKLGLVAACSPCSPQTMHHFSVRGRKGHFHRSVVPSYDRCATQRLLQPLHQDVLGICSEAGEELAPTSLSTTELWFCPLRGGGDGCTASPCSEMPSECRCKDPNSPAPGLRSLPGQKGRERGEKKVLDRTQDGDCRRAGGQKLFLGNSKKMDCT
jgi:hypothetical protein